MHQFPGFHPGFLFSAQSVVPLTLVEEVSAARVYADVQHEITLPSGIEAGDLGIIWHRGTDIGSPPATVTPAGFSSAHNFTWTESGLGMRNQLSFRLMDGTEDGSTVDTANSLAMFQLFRGNRPFRSVTSAGDVQSRDTGNPAPAVIASGAATTAALAFATYWITGLGLIDPRSMTPDKDDEWVQSAALATAWRFMAEEAVEDVTIDMDDESVRNFITGVYFALE